MYSAVENDTQCVPVCNRWRLKAEYHVERSVNSMPRGRILELKNNYGIIDTDAYKVEHEWIPFRIEKSMLEEKEGKQYIKYTDEVEFSLSQSQGVRDRDIKEATDIRFIGDEWKYQERIIENNVIQNIRKRLSEYNFYYPILDDKEFVDWLEGNNFQPRMLEYLSPGIFTCKEIIKMQAGKHIDLDCIDAKFKIGLLFVIDKIDIEFRKNILVWYDQCASCGTYDFNGKLYQIYASRREYFRYYLAGGRFYGRDASKMGGDIIHLPDCTDYELLYRIGFSESISTYAAYRTGGRSVWYFCATLRGCICIW